jgi:S-adenosyl-L-methionine hydrolase (adenosine-forming)
MKRKAQSSLLKKRDSRNIIALLTDFGDSDHYAGTMKGAILSVNPRANIVDISHNASPQNIRQAGYLLWASYRYFPKRTIFVCVVDPGVGTKRKIVGIETDKFIFLAPDNGLLDMVLIQEDVRRSYEIVLPPRIGSTKISPTFHGRDIFAPLAASLSLGRSLSKFGKVLEVKKPASVFYEPEKTDSAARILHIDNFGNIITNIPARYFGQCIIRIGRSKILTGVQNYAEAPLDNPVMIIGSSGLLEVVLRDGNAAQRLGVDLRSVKNITVKVGYLNS